MGSDVTYILDIDSIRRRNMCVRGKVFGTLRRTLQIKTRKKTTEFL
jgi:hypothetical protein